MVGRACAMLAAALALGTGCAAPVVPDDPLRSLEPPALFAVASDAAPATEPADRLLASFALEVAGDPDRALAVLLDGGAWADTRLEQARTVRVEQLLGAAPSAEESVAAYVEGRIRGADPVSEARWKWIADVVAAARRYKAPLLAALPWEGAATMPAVWRMAGPFSPLESLDLDRVAASLGDALPATVNFETGPQAVAFAPTYGGGVDVGGNGVGVYVIETTFAVDEATLAFIEVRSSAPLVAWVDDALAVRRAPEDVNGPQRVGSRLELAAGTHRVRVAVGVWSRSTPVQLSVVTDGDAPARFGPADPPWAGATVLESAQTARAVAPAAGNLAWLIAADDALERGDAIAASRLVETADMAQLDPVTAFHLARLAGVDFTRSARARDELRTAALTSAAADPAAVGARAALLEALVDRDQLAEAEPIAARLRLEGGECFDAQRALVSYATARGLDWQARAASRAALAIWPTHCGSIAEVLDAMRAVGPPIGPDTFQPEWLQCRMARVSWIQDVLLPRGRLDEAMELGRALQLAAPTELLLREVYVDTLLAGGRGDQVAAVFDDARRWTLTPADSLGDAVDSSFALGDVVGARRAFEELRDARPTATGLHLGGAVVTDEPLDPLVPDGRDVVADYLASGTSYDTDVVYVLDYAAYYYAPDGSVLEVVYQVLRVQSHDAIGEVGEVEVPSDANILVARTLKPDGRALTPDRIAGKDSLSMPALEIGDFVEIGWARQEWGPLASRTATRSDRFYFATDDGAMHRSEVTYVLDPSLPEPTFDVRGTGVRREQRAQDDGAVATTFSVEHVQPPVPESFAPPEDEWMPSVQMSFGLTLDDFVALYANRLPSLLGTTPGLESLARELTAEVRGPRAKARAIFRAVVDHVQDSGSFFRTPASYATVDGVGERTLVAYALLAAAGLDPEIVFVRTFGTGDIEGAVPDLGAFDTTVLRVAGAGERGGDVWLFTDADEFPFDYLPRDAQGRDAIAVWPREVSGRRITTPRWPDALELTTIDVVIHLDESGGADVEVVEQLSPDVAAVFRSFVQSDDDLEAVRRTVERTLTREFGQLTDLVVDLSGTDTPDARGTVRYEFRAARLARRGSDGTLVFDGALFARPIGSWYADRRGRELPLVISSEVIEDLTVVFEVPGGLRARELPSAAGGSWQDVSWSRDASASGSTTTVRRSIRLPMRRVSPAEYPEFATLARALEAAERISITFAP
ncbi:MAG: hypothetical protein H6700_01960 [Myxococcales bacterium]|nr:hypothetical protein [Myxococcales bacterium]MCB9530510.1 hypothetical protein [Myxococcales bacterium]